MMLFKLFFVFFCFCSNICCQEIKDFPTIEKVTRKGSPNDGNHELEILWQYPSQNFTQDEMDNFVLLAKGSHKSRKPPQNAEKQYLDGNSTVIVPKPEDYTIWIQQNFKNGTLLGTSSPYITPGSSVRQCNTKGYCFCVHKSNRMAKRRTIHKIQSGLPVCKECLAATNKDAGELSPGIGKRPIMPYSSNCTKDGFFEPKQCDENSCFCVQQQDGAILEETRVKIGDFLDCNAYKIDMINFNASRHENGTVTITDFGAPSGTYFLYFTTYPGLPAEAWNVVEWAGLMVGPSL